MCQFFFNQTLIVKHFGYFKLYSILNTISRNIVGEIFPHIHDYFLKIHSMTNNFIKKNAYFVICFSYCKAMLQKGNNLYSYQQVACFPTPLPTPDVIKFLIFIDIMNNAKYLILVFTYEHCWE